MASNTTTRVPVSRKPVAAPKAQRIRIGDYHSPSMNCTRLYEDGTAFYFRGFEFSDTFTRDGVSQRWLKTQVFDADTNELLGTLNTTATIVVATVEDVLNNAKAQGVNVSEIGPLMMDKGESAYFLRDADEAADEATDEATDEVPF